MNKYNHWLGKIFKLLFAKGGEEYCITLGQTSYFSCPPERVSIRWHKHEDCHKMQWAREGRIKFLFSYIWQQAAMGRLNTYEIEARAAELY